MMMNRPVFLLAAAAVGLLPSVAALARSAGYDGRWSVLVITRSGTCDAAYRYGVTVENGAVRYAGESGVDLQGSVDERGRVLNFRTNVDDWVMCDASHRLRFEEAAEGGLTPYLHVRADLWAKVTRALYYDLVDMGEERVVDGRPMFGVASGGEFFAMADADEVRGAL